jgi:hypothetical protein
MSELVRPTGGGHRITEFNGRGGWLWLYVVLGAAFVVQGIASAVYFTFFEDGEVQLRLFGAAMSLFLLWLGGWFASYGWRRIRDPEKPITVGPAGIHDRALSERAIAWSDIRNLHVWTGRGGPIVVFDVADGADERAGIFNRAKRARIANRPFGYTHHVHSMGTDASIDRLIEAISPYAEVRPY